MVEMVQAVSKSLVTFVAKFSFKRGSMGTPFAQGSGLCSTQVDKKDTHVWWILAQ